MEDKEDLSQKAVRAHLQKKTHIMAEIVKFHYQVMGKIRIKIDQK